MSRKKAGASLIFVVIIFMFVSTVSLAMLPMVASNYRARVIESKRVENLYSSESGLDITYNIIGKSFDAATKYGYYAVKELQSEDGNKNSPNNEKYINLKLDISLLKRDIENLQSEIEDLNLSDDREKSKKISEKVNEISKKNKLIDEDNEIIDILLNEEFKRAFNNFIKESTDKGSNEYIPNKLASSIENGKYVYKVEGINNKDLKEATVQYSENSTRPIISPEINKSEKESEESISIEEKNGHYKNVEVHISGEQVYTIKAISEFKSSENTNVIGTNTRKVQGTWTMLVPEYKDIFFENDSENMYEYVSLEDRGVTVGGNMNVEGIEELNVNSNIFVQGSEPNISNRVYDKYKGGIALNNIRNTINFNEDVITRGTFNIQSNVAKENSPVTIDGDLYARNIYAGSINPDELTNNAYLKIKEDLVIDNDLTVKATDTHIDIKNFYGINDKNINNDKSDQNEKVRTSSSIIINGYTEENKKESSVNITDSAYIMGTAYINTENGYQTGESAAVKGNYIAYSVPLDESDKFIVEDSLQLLDESNVFEKAKHFFNYWKDKKHTIKDGGIFLPEGKTYSVGAVVYKYIDSKNNEVIEVQDSTYNPSDESIKNEIESKKVSYASKVYKLNNEEITDESEKNALLKSYDLLGSDSIDVEDIMNIPNNLNELDNKYKYSISDQVGKSEKAIFNENSEFEIEIKKDLSATSDSIEIDYDNRKITIKLNKDGILNALIATNGNITIEGDITVNGNIITNGDLNIKDSGTVNINHDKEVVERIQAENIELFYDTFGSTVKENSNSNSNKTEEILDTQYDLNKFLNNKLWKIIK